MWIQRLFFQAKIFFAPSTRSRVFLRALFLVPPPSSFWSCVHLKEENRSEQRRLLATVRTSWNTTSILEDQGDGDDFSQVGLNQLAAGVVVLYSVVTMFSSYTESMSPTTPSSTLALWVSKTAAFNFPHEENGGGRRTTCGEGKHAGLYDAKRNT